MFSDISIFKILIYAAGIGFAAATVYTNIQRTALSKFINYLIDHNCFNESTSASLDDISLSPIQRKIVKSAVKHQYGLRKCIKVKASDESAAKARVDFFEGSDSDRYFLTDTDTDLLKKKYSYNTMPARLVILFVVALSAVVIAMSFFADWLYKTFTLPKIDNSGEKKTEVSQPLIENDSPDSAQDYVIPDNDPEITSDDKADNKSEGPRIPV